MTLFAAQVLSLAGVSAYADGEYAGKWQKMREKRQHAAQEVIHGLGLSAEQMTRIETARSRTQEEKQTMLGKIGEKKRALKDELTRPEPDRARIEALIGEISALKEQKLRQWVDSLLGIREILTPEQYSEFRQKMETKKADFSPVDRT